MSLLAALWLATVAVSAAQAQSVDWPDYGPKREGLRLEGLTNTVPDIVGPIDGSARLTVLTEGNHYPVFLPLVFDGFPAWCRETGRCDVAAGDILVVTLPQVMIVEALRSGAIVLGNAVLPLKRSGAVYPDVVIGGEGPLRRLAQSGIVGDTAVVFAKHRGMGLLLRRGTGVDSLADLAASEAPIVLATPNEAGARRQYLATLRALLGEPATDRLLGRAVDTWPGRLGIQHRDVPYALLNGRADAGILFGHLAAFYARAYPEQLRFVPVPKAAPFGQEIALTRTGRNDQLAAAFEAFLLGRAATAYPAGGFADIAATRLGSKIALDRSPRRD
ncbi:MAG: substrate-binding domain-containing protein [Acidobacteriota bacterium]